MKSFFSSLKTNTRFTTVYQVFYLIILLGLIFYFWNHTILYPFKLLVVFFHESSHALATILTGGEVKDFVVIQQQGGYVVSEGGIRFIILNSGYLGSLAWGLVIYLLAIKNKYNKILSIALGIAIGIITILFVKNLFALLFGLIITAAMIVIGLYVPDRISNFILRLIGLTSLVYVPLDVLSDTLLNSRSKSDATLLAEEYGGVATLWGGVWLIICIVVLYYCLRRTLKNKSGKKTAILQE